METQELVSIAPWTLIAMLCNLLIQAWIFKRLLFRPVQEILDRRQKEVEEEYRQAELTRQEAEDAQTAYEARLHHAEEDAAAVLARANERAASAAERIVSGAKAEANVLRERTERELAQERKQTRSELREELTGLAVELAERVTEKEIDAQRHAELIADFIDALGDVS